MVPIGHRP